MKVWVDLTNSPHVVVMRPLIANLRAAGHEVEVTARDFAQTLGLSSGSGSSYTPIGRHRGAGLWAKGRGLFERSFELERWARGRGSTWRWVTARTTSRSPPRSSGSRRSTMFDYEWATVQHNVNCRLAGRSWCPTRSRPSASTGTAPRGKLLPIPGSRRSTTWSTSSPTRGARRARARPPEPIVVVRTPPAVSLYHRFENDLFGAGADAPAGNAGGGASAHRRAARAARARRRLIVPEHAIDAQS